MSGGAVEQGGPHRPYVLAFARAMEQELAKNSHKDIGSSGRQWVSDMPDALLWHLCEETIELAEALGISLTFTMAEPETYGYAKPVDVILSEAADVGNFAMFIHDLYSEVFKYQIENALTDESPAAASPAGGEAP